MTKVILLSIRPKHLVNILNGKKTLELRKSVPKDFTGWVHLYCTKGNKNTWLAKFYEEYKETSGYTYQEMVDDNSIPLNGKVVARFWFDDFYQMDLWQIFGEYFFNNITLSQTQYHESLEELCLSREEILRYAGNKKTLYAWHIKKLEIFEKPMEIKDFKTKDTMDVQLICNYCSNIEYASVDEIDNSLLENGMTWGCSGCREECGEWNEMHISNNYKLKRAPQSYQYVYTIIGGKQ